MIKAITFDLDGVYFDKGKAEFIESLVKLGVSEGEAVRVFLKSDEMNKEYKEGRMTDEQFWAFATKEWGIEKTAGEMQELLMKGYAIDERVAKAVKDLRAKGYRTCICSNNFPARIEGLERKFGFLQDFDVVALSYEVGATKPSREIFETLVKKAGVKPDEIVFADDNEDNLEGAKEVGITAFFYDGFNNFLEKIRELGVEV